MNTVPRDIDLLLRVVSAPHPPSLIDKVGAQRALERISEDLARLEELERGKILKPKPYTKP